MVWKNWLKHLKTFGYNVPWSSCPKASLREATLSEYERFFPARARPDQNLGSPNPNWKRARMFWVWEATKYERSCHTGVSCNAQRHSSCAVVVFLIAISFWKIPQVQESSKMSRTTMEKLLPVDRSGVVDILQVKMSFSRDTKKAVHFCSAWQLHERQHYTCLSAAARQAGRPPSTQYTWAVSIPLDGSEVQVSRLFRAHAQLFTSRPALSCHLNMFIDEGILSEWKEVNHQHWIAPPRSSFVLRRISMKEKMRSQTTRMFGAKDHFDRCSVGLWHLTRCFQSGRHGRAHRSCSCMLWTPVVNVFSSFPPAAHKC